MVTGLFYDTALSTYLSLVGSLCKRFIHFYFIQMNFAKFLKTPDLLDKNLTQLGIIVEDTIIIKIDNGPDYALSDYKQSESTDYYFSNSWAFKKNFESIIEISIEKSDIFHVDSLVQIAKSINTTFDYDMDKVAFLTDILNNHPETYNEHSFDTNNDEFKLRNLRVKSIDNLKHRVFYEGSFVGSSYEIQPLDWGIYSTAALKAIPQSINKKPFYNSLIGESYLLMCQQSYRLAYFIAFSAFESFINYELGHEDAEKLKVKLKQVFKTKFPQLHTQQVYTSVMDKYDAYEQARHDIAHGRSDDLGRTEVSDLLIFITTLLISYNNSASTFLAIASLL